MSDLSTSAVVVAAGRGERLGTGRPKAFVPVLGRPMLVRTVQAVEACALVQRVVVVVTPEYLEEAGSLLRAAGCRRVAGIVAGGPHRQDSVAAGLAAAQDLEVTVVHDGARPLVRPEVIEAVVRGAGQMGAASAGIPIRETVKSVADGAITGTLDRSALWIAHTPQAFQTPLLREAHRRAQTDGFRAPDDALLVERLGHPVQMVEDSVTNMKITVPDDLAVAEAYLRRGMREMTRTGLGIDMHRLEMGRTLRLGGVEIPSPRGLGGHSDGDVLLHAVMDALLGAAGLGDIGVHFPPHDPAYRGADSLVLLGRVREMVAKEGWTVTHLDAMVLTEAPHLALHIPRMRERIAGALGLTVSAVSIKATTAEGLGAIGRGEGITAHAVATLITQRGQ